MTRNRTLFSLEGSVAIVTGAVGLLGRQHCLALAEAGADVGVADLDRSCAERFASELERGSGRRAIGIEMDITRPSSVEAGREAVEHSLGPIDILVNNAAIDDKVETVSTDEEPVRFEDFPFEQWQASLNVNVTGTFLCSQRIGAAMARRGFGSIINIASTYGIVAPDQRLYRDRNGRQLSYKGPAYPTTKGAVLSFTRFLAAYWGPLGVRVNALSPGGVENGQPRVFVEQYRERTPLARMAVPSDYKGALVFLASEASAYMTGANLVIDGGVDGVVTGGQRAGRRTLQHRAKRIRLVLTDCDGVLTDAGVYYSDHGEALKRFSVRDGMGVARLRRAGIETAIITQERSAAVKARAEKLQLRHLYLGILDKRAHLEAVTLDTGLELDELAFIGDDVNDLELMKDIRSTGLTGAPLDAMPHVRRIAQYRSPERGGHGAFRDFAEWLLALRGAS